jgi:uncharacterized HAD superfamily protein
MWTSTVCLLYLIWIFFFELFCFFSQLDEIIRDSTDSAYGEEHLAALTAGERTLWAEARQTYFSSGVNRTSLEAIEKAAFVLILDDEEYDIGTVSLSKYILQKIKNFSIKLIQLDNDSSSSSINNKVIKLSLYIYILVLLCLIYI